MARGLPVPSVGANTEPAGPVAPRNAWELITVAENLSILEFLQKMIDDVGLRDWFARDPQAALSDHGLRDVSPEDVRDAIVLADDSQTADFSRNVDQGFHGTVGAAAAHHGGHDGGRDGGRDGGHDGHNDGHSEGHREAIEHLSRYVTNNFVDDRDTNVDDSVNQQIHTDGGDVAQDIETHSTTASGDGAVAAGGDIRDSLVTSGNGNQIGAGNVRGDNNVQGNDNHVVHGDGNTTAFGQGAATHADLHNVDVDGGGALSVTGEAHGNQANTDTNVHTSEHTDNETHIEHSGNLDTDYTQDSNNETHLRADSDSHDHSTTNFQSGNELDHVDLPA